MYDDDTLGPSAAACGSHKMHAPQKNRQPLVAQESSMKMALVVWARYSGGGKVGCRISVLTFHYPLFRIHGLGLGFVARNINGLGLGFGPVSSRGRAKLEL